ncbi:STAS domain-containing protein [Actinoplanes sp. NPDC020271]|uniref:STAS domain-containing protein n=1 Tax=Actinoplanes sp. NPDC020271 TaxID=3363896 RepID=UPI0037B2E9BB
MNAPDHQDVPRLHTVVESAEDHCTVTLTGELDLLTAPVLVQLLNTATSVRHLSLDMAQLSFCDLAGLRALLQVYQAAGERGGTLAIRNPPSHVVWLLRRTGTTDLLLDDRAVIGAGESDDADDQPTPWPQNTPTPLRAPTAGHHPTEPPDDRDRRADDRDLLDRERGRLLDERAHRVKEHQRWEDIREDLANAREHDLEQRETANTEPPQRDGQREA